MRLACSSAARDSLADAVHEEEEVVLGRQVLGHRAVIAGGGRRDDRRLRWLLDRGWLSGGWSRAQDRRWLVELRRPRALRRWLVLGNSVGEDLRRILRIFQ